MNAKNDLEREIRDVLRPGAPTDDVRATWARTAIERSRAASAAETAAIQPASRRPRYALRSVVIAAVGFMLLIAAWRVIGWGEPRESDPAPTDERAAAPLPVMAGVSVDEKRTKRERAANQAVYAAAGTKKKLQSADRKAFAVIAGGSVRVDRDLTALLGRMGRLHPGAHHRFVFPLATEAAVGSDLVLSRSPVVFESVGEMFLGACGIKVTGKKGARKLSVGSSHYSMSELDGKIMLSVQGELPRPFRIEPDSLCPLVLKRGERRPRFEMPGRTIAEGLDRSWLGFRRYWVHVKNEALGIDRWVEAIGDQESGVAPGNWLAVNLGGHVFHGLRGKPDEIALREKRPVAVLRYGTRSSDRLQDLFEAVRSLGPCLQYAIPEQPIDRLDIYRRDGSAGGSLELAKATPADIERLLRKAR